MSACGVRKITTGKCNHLGFLVIILFLYSPTFYLMYIKTDLTRTIRQSPPDEATDTSLDEEDDDAVGHLIVHNDNLDPEKNKKDLELDVLNLASKKVTTIAFYEGFRTKWVYSFEPFESMVECTCSSKSVAYLTAITEANEVADYDVIVFPQDTGRRKPSVNEWASLYQTRNRYNKRQWWVYAANDCYKRLQSIVPPPPFVENSFDMSVTYHSKSDVTLSFGQYDRSSYSPQKRRNWAENKDYLVAWTSRGMLPSQLRGETWQDAFVKRLEQRIEVHKYSGNVKDRKMPSSDMEWRKVMEKYKFHLSFETYCCDEYITETFWQILEWDVVPVVIGASKENYLRVAPPHSFIYADKFENLHKFVDYIKLLDSNDELYNEYFRWKERGRVGSYFTFHSNFSAAETEIPSNSIYSCSTGCKIAEKYEAENNRNFENTSKRRHHFNPRAKWWAQSCHDCGTHDWIRKFSDGE